MCAKLQPNRLKFTMPTSQPPKITHKSPPPLVTFYNLHMTCDNTTIIFTKRGWVIIHYSKKCVISYLVFSIVKKKLTRKLLR